MKYKKTFKELLGAIVGSTFLILVSIIVLLIVPFFVIKDTIEAKGGLIHYDLSHGGTNNYFLILSSIVLWWAFFKFIEDSRQARQKYKILQQKIEQAKATGASLSEEEKAIQAKMDEILQNIIFLGRVPNNKSKGYFCCQSCGYHWEGKINKIYNRKMCGQDDCHISYQKNR
ncbi:hypothetical protein ACVRZR_00415 [Streptococcus entericus]|uniref:hypothetical protein n=1 Tax=Streptococcus entericus TaxID=155680 RepID=UPI00036FCCA2|nr:hypothetical protein [Streptococcus entericus]